MRRIGRGDHGRRSAIRFLAHRQQARLALAQRDTAQVESARNVHAREARALLEGAIAAYDAAGAEDSWMMLVRAAA